MPRSERVMDVVSFETLWEINPKYEWIAKGAARIQEEGTGDLPAFKSTTYLAVQRFNFNVWRPVYIGVEYRALLQRQTDDQRRGFLGEVMWNLQKRVRVGIGYNFTDFSDNEFSQNDYSVDGGFLRVQGRY